MDTKRKAFIVFGILLFLFLLNAKSKNNYKESKNFFPLCVNIIFTDKEICMQDRKNRNKKTRGI